MDPAIGLDIRMRLSVVVLDRLGATRRLSGDYSVAQAMANVCLLRDNKQVVGWDLSYIKPPQARYV